MSYNDSHNNLVVFVVVGRLARGLVISKVAPIIGSSKVNKVFVFSQDPHNNIEGIDNIIVPDYIKNFKIRFLKKLIRQIYEPIQLLQYAIKYKPDYINGIFTLPKGLNSLIVSKLIRCKSIISVIGGIREILTYNKFTYFWKHLNLWMLKKCTIVTTKGTVVSKYLCDNGISKEKIFIFNGSIDTNIFYYNDAIKKDIDILFVGAFTYLKGPDRTLEVIEALQKKYTNLISYFIGEGPLITKITKKINKKKLSNIVLTGYIDNLDYYYQRAKIIIMPSRSEGLPTAMLEAMSCRCVPIVSNVGNIKDAAIHDVNAMVVDNHMDIDTFARYADELLSESNKLLKLSIEGEKIVKEKYSVKAQVDIFNRIICST